MGGGTSKITWRRSPEYEGMNWGASEMTLSKGGVDAEAVSKVCVDEYL